ncbi:DapH/DapD/GlmU-related protein [Actinomycetospora sp. CA-101289]|uniref:DapH/DapD/GlmU-related protein n=1 Tax=Actinomycetospora sp. CA-101289 TaxID=3239893 RepID=UPI003D9883F4
MYIGKYCTIEADGSIGAGSMIANSVGVVGRTDHSIDDVGRPIRESTWVGEREAIPEDYISIGRDCWIGFGAVLLSGVEIGNSVVVAAGSVVARSVVANSVVAGNPAKVLGPRFAEEDFLRHEAILDRRYGAV